MFSHAPVTLVRQGLLVCHLRVHRAPPFQHEGWPYDCLLTVILCLGGTDAWWGLSDSLPVIRPPSWFHYFCSCSSLNISDRPFLYRSTSFSDTVAGDPGNVNTGHEGRVWAGYRLRGLSLSVPPILSTAVVGCGWLTCDSCTKLVARLHSTTNAYSDDLKPTSSLCSSTH
ncbi:uncharacterized protein C8Q71DRAFT_72640 [Rhodofomes roseus]|uniref:Uncharacterized protein n=1 Tax=Rhodofomes roseus TaxID=34475 RepID=A0ABQ8KF29_9APHY|nr:uncharacterized protein C8Q71DRAFT_72640 [Rhodofomes roseus]KAH9836238.1 hypothetical protein C8Q71DRAFT_72640 [Rhodofomes roseus]